MSESPYIHNVSMQNFQNLVLEKSINKPVLVDFWADWCQPCQTIMPMLAKLAEEYGGKFELAKVNADAGAGTGRAFRHQEPADDETVLPGADRRRKRRCGARIRYSRDARQAHRFGIRSVHAGRDDGLSAGPDRQALEMLNHALAKDPDNAELKVTIAQMVNAQGDSESAHALARQPRRRRQQARRSDQVTRRNQAGRTARRPARSGEIEQRLAQNPLDLEACCKRAGT